LVRIYAVEKKMAEERENAERREPERQTFGPPLRQPDTGSDAPDE